LDGCEVAKGIKKASSNVARCIVQEDPSLY
jgi:hypothetical protein